MAKMASYGKKTWKKSEGLKTKSNIVAVLSRIAETILNESKKRATGFFESSSIHCYQYVVDYTLKLWERRMWRLLHLVSICVAFWVMWVAGGNAILTPVAVSRRPVGAPIVEVPHPAVALCSLNRISKRKTTQLAKELIVQKSLNYTIDQLVDMLGNLGYAYDLELPDSDELDVLHHILEPYNLDMLLHRLTPTCDDFVKRCIWKGRLEKCSALFTMRKTMDGYCCIFNYQRETDLMINLPHESANGTIMARPSFERGLRILVDPDLEDHFYTKYPHEGTKVLVFNPYDYPDLTSGSCVQQSVAPSTELYVNLEAIFLSATKDLKQLPLTTRWCIAAEDRSNYLVSFSDCMVNCRVTSIEAMCHCVPFFLPSNPEFRICNLLDNVCLNRWKDYWFVAWSGEEALVEDGQEAGDMQEPPCQYCLPACEEAVYRARQHAVNLQPEAINSHPDSELLKQGVVFRNHSVVNIYFAKDVALHLELGLLSKWFDLFSTMGGICGLVLGGSIISIVEWIYFILGGPVTKNKHKHHAQMRELYWEELRNYKRS